MDQSTKNFYINPEILRWARITIGFTQENAAKKLDVKVEQLKKWEEGKEEAPLRKIRKFSAVYRRATTAFLLNSIPEENIPTKFRKLLYDNINSFSTATLLAIRKVVSIQNLAKDVFDIGSNIFIKDIQKLSTISDYDQIAEQVIMLLVLNEKIITKNKPVFEQLNLWKNAIEAKGIYVVELGFPVEEAKGFAIYDNIAPVITLNTNDHPKVRIFTLLHELSHLIFHSDAIGDQGSLFNYSTDNSLEAKCNFLAGNIILPTAYLKQKVSSLQLNPKQDIDTTLEVLTRVFNVSKQVTLRRLLNENLISKDLFVARNKLLRESYIHVKPEKKKRSGGDFYVKFFKNNSRAFVYDIMDAYKRNRISYLDILNYLNIRSTTLSKLEYRL